jgi:hypothetical protein
MTNKKKSVKNQKKKTPQKMFPYRKRGDKKGKQNKTSKRTIQGGSRVDELYRKATGDGNDPSSVMESIMKNDPSGAMKNVLLRIRWPG